MFVLLYCTATCDSNPRENVIRLSLALKNNPRSVLVHLDLSDNTLDDKSMLRTTLNCMWHVYLLDVVAYHYYMYMYVVHM